LTSRFDIEVILKKKQQYKNKDMKSGAYWQKYRPILRFKPHNQGKCQEDSALNNEEYRHREQDVSAKASNSISFFHEYLYPIR